MHRFAIADLRFGRLQETQFFSLEMELAGMLAPEVQATTIDNRVPPREGGVNDSLIATCYLSASHVGLTGFNLVP
jgi:hypothetical protein